MRPYRPRPPGSPWRPRSLTVVAALLAVVVAYLALTGHTLSRALIAGVIFMLVVVGLGELVPLINRRLYGRRRPPGPGSR